MKNLNQNYNFMKRYKLSLYVSLFLIFISLFSLFVKGLNYGIDFSGGTIIEISFNSDAPINGIREYLKNNNYKKFSVQFFGSNKNIIIKISNLNYLAETTLSNAIVDDLRTKYSFNLSRVENVGAQVGDELRDQGILATCIALLLIMIYIALRFEYRFAIAAVIALFHDVIIIIGTFSITQVEFDLTVFAAILAIIGYSLNDTIVVFDRIRENFIDSNKDNLSTEIVLNQAINDTLSRTIITSLTTLLVVIALLIFGGETLFGFSFALTLGIFFGTYSSIYIASAILLMMNISIEDLIIGGKEKDKP